MLNHRIEAPDKIKEGRLKLIGHMERQEFLRVPDKAPYSNPSGDNPDWTYGDHKTKEALTDSLVAGRPTQTAWKMYLDLKEKSRPSEDADKLQSIKRRRWTDETGDEVDMDRYLRGDSRCWNTYRKVGRKLAVTLGYQIGLSCGNAEEQFAENSANLVVLADALLEAGYMVRIIGMWSAWGMGNFMGKDVSENGLTFPLMEFGEPLDEAMLLSFGTPGSLRYFGFNKIVEEHGGEADFRNNGMGHASKTSDQLLKMAGIDIMVAKQWHDAKQGDFITNLTKKAREVAEASA